jgi:hypothetical protein
MDLGGCTFSLRSKGNFLYSAATAHSTMDYSSKNVDDDVVDSPPNDKGVRLPVSSPSPLRKKCAIGSPLRSMGRIVPTQRKLYETELASPEARPTVVSMCNYCS